MRKGQREVQCLVVYLAIGFDLRLLDVGDLEETLKSGHAVEGRIDGAAHGAAHRFFCVSSASRLRM
jgi:hypothetical protein